MSRSIPWMEPDPDTSDAKFREAYPRFRSLPDPHVDPQRVGEQGWHRRDLLLPALTLRADAVEHNARLHARWCEQYGVLQAPHAKTHMSPELVRLQLDSGAWGLTAASVHQARFLAAAGVSRIILAHEVVDRANAVALARLARQYPQVDVMPIVDSRAGVELLSRHLAEAGMPRPLPVMVELGVPGGRTGARTEAELVRIATAVHADPMLRLVGVEGFEGILPVGRDAASLAGVDEFLARLVAAMVELDRRGLFSQTTEVLLTAGGSVYPDRLAAVDRPDLGVPVRLVVRSGATITHDHGPSSRCAPLSPEADHPLGGLKPALELWAAVVSTPEPGIALANFGKRDAPYDSHMPVVLQVLRGAETLDVAGISVDRVNDQHAYLSHRGQLQVGDVLRLGPCHPCTAFDKWSLVPVLDDQDAVIGAITTWF